MEGTRPKNHLRNYINFCLKKWLTLINAKWVVLNNYQSHFFCFCSPFDSLNIISDSFLITQNVLQKV